KLQVAPLTVPLFLEGRGMRRTNSGSTAGPRLDRYYIEYLNEQVTNEPRWSARELKSELNRYEEQLRAAGKTRNTISTYVQHPDRSINGLEGRYRPTQADANWNPGPPAGGDDRGTSDERRMPGGTSRYDPLKRYLAERTDPVIHLSFGEIER